MYDHHLDTFLQVADSGSFLRAAEKLFISANAVTKQINLLENDLGLKLFRRGPRGLELTEAGKLIYTESKGLIRHVNSVLDRARQLEGQSGYTVRVGVSLMNPVHILLEYWSRVSAQHPNFRLDVVPFVDSPSAFYEALDRLGEDIDLIPCPYSVRYWEERYNTFHLCDLPMRIACSRSHPLAGKEVLRLEDLHGQTIIFRKRSLSDYADRAIRFLEQDHPQIRIKEIDLFTTELFNQTVSTQDLLMFTDCWSNVQPMLVTLPVDWDFTIPYGLIYAKSTRKELLKFIQSLRP